MSKTYRHELTERRDLKARIHAMRGSKPLSARELEKMRERAFDAINRKLGR